MGVQLAKTHEIEVYGTRGSNNAKAIIDRLAATKTTEKVIGLEVSGNESKYGIPPSFPTRLKEYAESKGIKVVPLDSRSLSRKFNALLIARDFKKEVIDKICKNIFKRLLKCREESTQKSQEESTQKKTFTSKELNEMENQYNFFKQVNKFVEKRQEVEEKLRRINELRDKRAVEIIRKYKPRMVIVHDTRVQQIVDALNKHSECKARGLYLESMDTPYTKYHDLSNL